MGRKEFDSNMLVNPKIDREGMRFYNIDEAPFKIYGVWREGERYIRMSPDAARAVSAGVYESHINTSGGRVRFTTDSPYVAIHAKLSDLYQFTAMAFTGTCGLDVYSENEFLGTVRPSVEKMAEIVEEIFYFPTKGSHTVTLNMPLYCGVNEIYIGLDGSSALCEAPEYKVEKPVVFYGSSITNGAVASRPGMTYESMLSRRLDINYHNLGFGGLAMGEVAMAEYIASLEMSAFVLDYDHNAPNPEYLAKTHERFFKIVREKNPELPILMISGPRIKANADREARKDIIRQTYNNAVAAGDKNVYILMGDSFFSEVGVDYTADGTHPTDLGFWLMAKGIAPTLEKMLFGK